MVTAEDVRTYISQAGPVLPKHIAEAFGISTLFASAFLSELSSDNRILTSHLKIGGSPLYYTAEHRDRLVDYRGNLHEKEQKTFELLRSEKVLDDSALELLDRVALRKMEDFAVPLAVDVDGARRIFWKYYLTPDDQITALISEILEAEVADARAAEAAQSERSADQKRAGVEEDASGHETLDEHGLEAHHDSTRAESSHRIGTQPSNTSAARASDPSDRTSDRSLDQARSTTPQAVHKPVEKKVREAQSTISTVTPSNVTVTQAPDASEALNEDPLGRRVLEYFTERTIRIIEAEVVRKNTCQGVCSVPSPVGELDYYFFAKDKKSITDKDVKEAFAEAAILGYPLLFIAKGDVKKSATELIGSKIKGSVIIEL
jgi:hypothetical protein